MSKPIPKHGEFCWNELMTPDVKKAKDFYANLFSWQSQDVPCGDMTYTMFKLGDKDAGGMLQSPPGQEHMPRWVSYINVENLDSTITKAQSLGAKITVPSTPVGEFGRFAIIQDPTGASLALWQSLQTN